MEGGGEGESGSGFRGSGLVRAVVGGGGGDGSSNLVADKVGWIASSQKGIFKGGEVLAQRLLIRAYSPPTSGQRKVHC
jgi:hypothetical protein